MRLVNHPPRSLDLAAASSTIGNVNSLSGLPRLWPSIGVPLVSESRQTYWTADLGGMPTNAPLPVLQSKEATAILRADLENENNTIRAYRERVRQCETLGEYAIAEDIREIIRQEQEHQVDLATALGEDAPDVSQPAKKR